MRIKIIIVIELLLTSFISSAFSVDGINYSIINESSKEVEVIKSTCSGDVTIPSSIKYNGIYYSVTSVGSRAFLGCENLMSITLPNSVTSIGSSAFCYCESLMSITLPNSVTSIGSDAFWGCESLMSITLPNSVTSIGSDAFRGCNLKKAIWLCNTPPSGNYNVKAAINYVSNNQFNFDNQKVYPFLSSLFEVDGTVYVPVSPSERTCDVIDCNYNPTSKEIVIGETVKNKGIELKVLNINDYAFYDNDSITSISLSNNGYIGYQSFYNCDGLTSVLANNNGYIGQEAFNRCQSLTEVDITSKGNIGDKAFEACNAIIKANINNNGSIGELAFLSCNRMTEVTLGNTINTISYSAFEECSSLPVIIIPDNVTSIGSSVFGNCTKLTSVHIGAGISSIPDYAFSGCSSLNNLIIPNNVKTIGDYAFSGCTSLADLTLEEDATGASTNLQLGSNGKSPLFSDCPLDEVFIGRKLSYKTTSYYGYSPFYRNTSLRSVKITDSETQICDNEFYGCTNLQEFSCGDGVTSIGKWAFSGCSALKSYSSGSNVKTVGQEAFSDCTGLTSFTTLAAVPPTCGNQALDDINKWDCVLHVPSESVDDYKTAPQWKEFFFIEEAAGVEDVVADESAADVTIDNDGFYFNGNSPRFVEVYTIDGKLQKGQIAQPQQKIFLQSGFYIVRIGSQTMKIKI